MNGISKVGKILGIILILPIVAMAIYAVIIANSEIDVEDVVSVSVSDGRYKYKYSGKDDIGKYVSLIENAEEGAVQDIEYVEKHYVVEFEMKSGSVKTYQFYPYFSGYGLLKDGTGHIRNCKDLNDILKRDEYNSLYVSRYLPEAVIKLSEDKEPILPLEYTWFYQKSDGKFYPYDGLKTSTEEKIYDINLYSADNGIISFSKAPDVYVVEFLYDGKTYSKIENISLNDGDELTLTVSAQWKKGDKSTFYGDGKWRFKCIYRESPVISIDKIECFTGECFVLRVENIDAGETLQVETDIVTNKTPKVYNGKEGKIALIPVDLKTRGGDHVLNVSYGDVRIDFPVTIKESSDGFAMKNIDADVYNTVMSPDGINEFNKFIEGISSKTEKNFLWDSVSFTKPVVGEIDTNFACEVLYNGVPPQVYFEGTSFNVKEKTSVKSAAKGKVVFSGETSKTGKAIVIDHGCGVMTHYWHLSVLSAFEGEEIEEGKLIALSGKTGFTDKADLFFGISVNGVFVKSDVFEANVEH